MRFLSATSKSYDATYCGQFQSPFFISLTTGASRLGPFDLHLRHCALRAKFMKVHLQQVNVSTCQEDEHKEVILEKGRKKEDEGEFL